MIKMMMMMMIIINIIIIIIIIIVIISMRGINIGTCKDGKLISVVEFCQK